jgi:hypothetical protein
MARILVFSNVGCNGCHGRTDGEMIHGVTSSETFFLFYLADPYDICIYIYLGIHIYGKRGASHGKWSRHGGFPCMK